jgi:hypothetical protein
MSLIHHRHFTREEANAALEGLRPLLRRLCDVKDLLTDAETHDVLANAAPGNGGGEAGVQVGESFLEVRRLISVIQDAGIVIRDIDRGLIDFPALIDGREVYLCWELGEDEVTHWHDLDAGYGGRQPL